MSDPVYYEDIEEGATFTSLRRTITDADILNFAGVSGDFNPLHIDDIFVREHTAFRARIAHGLLSLAVGTGLSNDSDRWQTLAFLECTRRFVGPVYAGDTIYVRYRVASKRESNSNRDRGIVTLDIDMVNQDGTVVQTGQDVSLVGKRRSR